MTPPNRIGRQTPVPPPSLRPFDHRFPRRRKYPGGRRHRGARGAPGIPRIRWDSRKPQPIKPTGPNGTAREGIGKPLNSSNCRPALHDFPVDRRGRRVELGRRGGACEGSRMASPSSTNSLRFRREVPRWNRGVMLSPPAPTTTSVTPWIGRNRENSITSSTRAMGISCNDQQSFRS